MKMQSFFAVAVTVLMTSAGAASADTLSYTYSTSGLNYSGSAPNIVEDLSSPSTLTVNGPQAATSFITTDPGYYCGSYGCEVTEQIKVTFSFSGLTPVAGSVLSETATYEAKYGGAELPCSSSGSGDTDCLLWGSTTSGTASITDSITFTNNDILNITLYNAQDWDITSTISWDWTNTGLSQTPLPATLPLFAGGLSVMGLLGWRRKRKAAAMAV